MGVSSLTIARSDVDEAWRRIERVVAPTPLLVPEPAGRDDLDLPGDLVFTCEFQQHTGSVKARGAADRVLVAQADGCLDPRVGIVAASGGNAGLANA